MLDISTYPTEYAVQGHITVGLLRGGPLGMPVKKSKLTAHSTISGGGLLLQQYKTLPTHAQERIFWDLFRRI